MARPSQKSDVREQILAAAMEMAQKRGLNAFSYIDISKIVGVKTSTIHYYFPAKADLARELIVNYRREFGEALADIKEKDGHGKLEAYARVFARTLKEEGRLCLWCMFASDYDTLTEDSRLELKGFVRDNETWLRDVLQAGRDAGEFRFDGPPVNLARTIFSLLEGAMITARAMDDTAFIRNVMRPLHALVRP